MVKKTKKIPGKAVKKKEKKLTKAQIKKRIFRLLNDIEYLFDYQNFDRSFVFEKEEKENTACEVVTDLEYRRVTIKIYPCFMTHSVWDQRQLLLHEFCHTYTDKIYQLAVSLLNGKYETFENFRRANEEATSRITETMEALLRGRLRYARKAYARFLDPKKK